MRAVEQGAGYGLAVLPLSEPWISQGRIHLVDNKLCALDECYWLLWRQGSPKHARLLTFADALQAELEAANQRIRQLLS